MPDVDRSRPLIRDRGDLGKIRTPDFECDGRFRQVIEMNKLFRRLIGGAAEMPVQFCAPFSLAANIRGIEQLILDIYSDPTFARDLFDRITEELLVPWILRLQTEFLASLKIVKKMTIEEKIAFWREVMQYGQDRGIEFHIITWNLFVWGADG